MLRCSLVRTLSLNARIWSCCCYLRASTGLHCICVSLAAVIWTQFNNSAKYGRKISTVPAQQYTNRYASTGVHGGTGAPIVIDAGTVSGHLLAGY